MLKPNIDVRKIYRQAVGQTTASRNPDEPKRERRQREDENYERYLRKAVSGRQDEFTGLDLVYFFRDTSKAAGYRYSISNLFVETGCMKNLLNEYTPIEICDMIRFVFESGQDYLNKATCSPHLISSNWRNTLYPDSRAWLAGEYVGKKSKHIKKREWGAKKQTPDIKIGEWDE